MSQPANDDKPSKTPRRRLDADDYFGMQPTSTVELPDPLCLVQALTVCIMEVLSGARDLDQIARWVSDDVYRHLLKRVVISQRARQAKGQTPHRPQIRLGGTRLCEPRDGIIEAVVIVHGRARSRAVSIRLEGLDRRWRASAVHVL